MQNDCQLLINNDTREKFPANIMMHQLVVSVVCILFLHFGSTEDHNASLVHHFDVYYKVEICNHNLRLKNCVALGYQIIQRSVF